MRQRNALVMLCLLGQFRTSHLGHVRTVRIKKVNLVTQKAKQNLKKPKPVLKLN